MSVIPPRNLAKIIVNGEEYLPRPHEVNPEIPRDYEWRQTPENSAHALDAQWYDSMDQNWITRRRIWGLPSESAQIEEFWQLLQEFPNRGLDMMFAAAVKGKAYVVRFLLEQGVKATAVQADGDDGSLVPLHVAAYRGHLECVKIFIESGYASPDALDSIGMTPLMQACRGKRPEVVEYLLNAGSDVFLRLSPTAGLEFATNAFEFAAESGCIECANMILRHAEQRGTQRHFLATTAALGGAAQSDCLGMVNLIMESRNYPRPRKDGPVSLTNKRRADIEFALNQALRSHRYKALKSLLAYFECHNEGGEFHWTKLDDHTADNLIGAIWATACRDDNEHRQSLAYIIDLLLHPNSHLAPTWIQNIKNGVLNHAYFKAVVGVSLENMHLIEDKHQDLDVNHLKHPGGGLTTPLYMAASGGHTHIVNHLVTKHKHLLNIHLASGEYANGPTAMWVAVRNGHTEVVRTLLREVGGPVDYIDFDLRQRRQGKVIVTATEKYRYPVAVYSEIAWVNRHSDKVLDENAMRGTFRDEQGNQVRYVIFFEIELSTSWWNHVETRKTDAELMTMERWDRLIERPPATVS